MKNVELRKSAKSFQESNLCYILEFNLLFLGEESQKTIHIKTDFFFNVHVSHSIKLVACTMKI